MKCVLGIDLSTSRGHIAVVREDRSVIYEADFTSERSHNSMLYGPLAEALEIAGGELQSIVVGTGPGSYTGVRISIAAAYGVALSRGVSVHGLPSIAALHEGAYAVIGDARRGKYYAAVVRDSQLEAEFVLLDEPGLRAWLGEHDDLPFMTSDGKAPLALHLVKSALPSAVTLALHGLRSGLVEADHLEPLYVQEAFITKAKTPTMGSKA